MNAIIATDKQTIDMAHPIMLRIDNASESLPSYKHMNTYLLEITIMYGGANQRMKGPTI